MIRFWSPISAPAGRMPGTMSLKSGPHCGPERLNLHRAAHHAVETCLLGIGGEAEHLILRRPSDAHAMKIRVVETGEYRHPDNPGSGPFSLFCSVCCGAHHGHAAAGMHIDDGWIQLAGRPDAARDGVWNVVQLEVEKDRNARLCDRPIAFLTEGIEELKPDLQAANLRRELARERFCFPSIICIKA